MRVAYLACCLALSLLAACSSSPPPAPSLPEPAPILGNGSEDVLINAIGLVGTPYRYGGNTPDSGFDCSGLIGYVYRQAGLSLPRSTREMVRIGAPNVAREQLQSGDLVFFATQGAGQVSHAGIYVGQGRFVHAPSSGGTVRLDYLSQAYWQRSFLTGKRVLSLGSLAQHP